MERFDKNRIDGIKLEIAKMYSLVLGISSNEFETKLSDSFSLDYIDLLVLKVLEDSGFDMNNVGTYLLGFVIKDEYIEIIGNSGSFIASEIRAQGSEMLVNLGFNSLVSKARESLTKFNNLTSIRFQKDEMRFDLFKKMINDAIRKSCYGAEGYIKYNDDIFIRFIRDIKQGNSSYKVIDVNKLSRRP